ncbi:MAG: L,D-transpeptidase [Gemmatimonadota bacterium]
MKLLVWTAGILSGFGTLAGCSRDKPPADPPKKAVDSAPAPAPLPPPDPVPATPPLAAVVLDSGASFRDWVRSLGPDRLTLIFKLNRIDLQHARAGDTLIVPADTTLGPDDLAPFPERIALLDSVPRLLAVSRRIQAVAAYDSGRLVRWGPTSTGKRKTPTPTGLSFTTWKAKQTRSTENDEWILNWYFNFDNTRGVSFHEYALPGYPASHACVRLHADDAKWIYDWADQWKLSKNGLKVLRWGTPVVIFEDYDYKAPRPWRHIVTDPEAARVSAAQLDSVVTGYLPTIKARQVQPDSASAPR